MGMLSKSLEVWLSKCYGNWHIYIKRVRPVAAERTKIWRCHPDSDRGMKVLQTFALPLGYGTINIKMER